MAPYPIQRVIGDGGKLWNASFFFLTLTSDETSNLRWKEIEDIENLAMFFNNTFSWKDCLVECVALFCARLQAFMSTYVLGGESILGIVDIVVTYSQFDSNIRVFYVFLGFFRNTLKYFTQRPIFKPLYFYNDFLKILENTSF
jgi:hypothetical protein